MDNRTNLQTAAAIERAIEMRIPDGACTLHDLGVRLETAWRVLLQPERRRAPAAVAERSPADRRPPA